MTEEEKQQERVAFVGPKSYYLAFAFLGMHCVMADEGSVYSVIEKLRNDGFTLIFTTEDLLSQSEEGVVVLPGMQVKSKGETIKKEIQRAIGSDISFFLKE